MSEQRDAPDVLWVTNTTEDALTVSYEYRSWEFRPGVPTAVPPELARFVFAHGEDNLLPAVVRLGFAPTNRDIDAGLERLAKFTVSSTAPQPGVVPIPVKHRREPPIKASA